MRVLCILDSIDLLKKIKTACDNNDTLLKVIAPDDKFDSYFDDFTPDVIVLQGHYEDISTKFLLKLLRPYASFKEGIKLLIAEDASNLDDLSAFASEADMLLIEQEAVGMALCTKVKAMVREKQPKHLSRRKLILYVSDNKFMHIVIKDAFAGEAVDLMNAYDGNEAISKIEERQPDLILTDLDIPGLSGIELCKTIKRNKKFAHIPVIIYSSYEKTEVFKQCNEAGASGYFEKNQNPKEFAKSLLNYL